MSIAFVERDSSERVTVRGDCSLCKYQGDVLFRDCPNILESKGMISVFCCRECYTVWEAYRTSDGKILSGERIFPDMMQQGSFRIDGETYIIFGNGIDWKTFWKTECNYPIDCKVRSYLQSYKVSVIELGIPKRKQKQNLSASSNRKDAHA
mmetsp:Transcript_28533/g.55526  ORF Transcript_28533/g.55526 Transcript_28533/m.55526 type:complete len:151 (+) Transcript_28533:20-472(+)